jgi:hypothetical protein
MKLFRGADVVRGSLNWGPTTWLNGVWKTYGWWSQRRALYADDFHTYTLEWTPEWIKIYVDSPLFHMLEVDMKKFVPPLVHLFGFLISAAGNPSGNVASSQL